MECTKESKAASKCNKMLEDVHALSIIKEVEKWPTLYSKDSRERGNAQFKMKIWREVAKSLFDGWETFTESEKDCKVIELIKRWRNLRDTFKRQLEVESKKRQGQDIKRKTYVYFKPMLFLLPHMSHREAADALTPHLTAYFNKKDKRKEKRREKMRYPLEQHMIEEIPYSTTSRTSAKSSVTDDIDEDRHFALSLVPTLKKMTDDEKLTAKMEILKVLREVRSRTLKDSTRDTHCNEESDENHAIKVEYFFPENVDVSINSESGRSEQDSD